MSKKFVIILTISTLFLSGCGLISGMNDLTSAATTLLEDASDLLKMIDTKVESGDMSRELGDLLDGRISHLMDELESALENGGGALFEGIDGTIDNTFANLSQLITQIKQEILDDSIPNIIESLSAQLQLQVNNLSSQLEDIIILTFGKTYVLVDKATNSLIIIASIIFLAIGLLIFGIILLRKKQKATKLNKIGLGFAGLYTLFFLSMILVSPLRGYVIAGFNFGEKYEGTELKPKIKGVIPETFTVGKSKRIVIYGNHLNKLDSLNVFLYQSNQKKFTFPKNTIIEATRNRIILGNFKNSLGWAVPSYAQFKQAVITTSASSSEINKYKNLSYQINESLYPERVVQSNLYMLHTAPIITPSVTSMDYFGATPLRQQTRSFQAVKTNAAEMSNRKLQISNEVFGQAQSVQVIGKIQEFFAMQYKLPEGDFGLRVFQDKTPVESPQFISVFYPPPPPPKPDIAPISLNWVNGIPAIKKEKSSLVLQLGFAHPEEVKTPFKVRITSTPPTATINHQVSQGDIAAAGANNFVDVITRTIRPEQSGNLSFLVKVDYTNKIEESNEGNNQFSNVLPVQQYVYDAQVTFTTFQARKNYDDYQDEFRISVKVDVTNNSRWSFSYNKNGESGKIYNVNKSRTFSNLKPGDVIALYTSGYEEDDPDWFDPHDNMGSAQYSSPLGANPTSGKDSEERSSKLTASGYYLNFKIRITRRVI